MDRDRKVNEKKKKTRICIGERLLNLLYPPRCPLCDQILTGKDGLCCRKCEKDLPWISGPTCMKCGKMIAEEEEEFCDDCRRYHHRFDRGTAAFAYTGQLRHSIYRMKAENRRDYLDFYADAMVRALKPYLGRWKPECIVAIPMHWQKKWKRGYNQSELLAKKIAERTGILLERSWVYCCKKTKEQKKLGRKERENNLSGCFAFRQPEKRFRRVLIVDDIYTTGSTMDELAALLKEQGTQEIYFVVLCIGKGKKRVCTKGNVCYTEIKSWYFRKKERREQNEQPESMVGK